MIANRFSLSCAPLVYGVFLLMSLSAAAQNRPVESFFEGQRHDGITALRRLCDNRSSDYRIYIKMALPLIAQMEQLKDQELLMRIHGFVSALYAAIGDRAQAQAHSDIAQELFRAELQRGSVEDVMYTSLLLNYDLRTDDCISTVCREIGEKNEVTRGQFLQALVEFDDHIDDLLTAPRKSSSVQSLRNKYRTVGNQLMSAAQASDIPKLRETLNRTETILREISKQHSFPELADKRLFDVSVTLLVAEGRLLLAFLERNRRDYRQFAKEMAHSSKAFSDLVSK